MKVGSAPGRSPDDFTELVATFKASLAVPLESMFRTEEEIDFRPPPPEPTAAETDAARSQLSEAEAEQQKSGQMFLATRELDVAAR